jgi:hypothetical protein
VTDRETASIRLELKWATEPISGCLYDERGGRQPFLGWLSLLSVLDDVTSRVAGTPDRHPAGPSGHVDGRSARRREDGDESS